MDAFWSCVLGLIVFVLVVTGLSCALFEQAPVCTSAHCSTDEQLPPVTPVEAPRDAGKD